MKAWWAAFLAVVAVTVALAWPAGAGRVALAAVVAAAAAIGVPALAGVRRRYPLEPGAASPGDLPGPPRPAADRPNRLVVLERSVGAAGTEPLSFAVREQLRASARRRLGDHHRLELSAVADQAEIARRVSPALWSIVGPLPRDRAGNPLPAPTVPAAALAGLIEEVRAL